MMRVISASCTGRVTEGDLWWPSAGGAETTKKWEKSL